MHTVVILLVVLGIAALLWAKFGARIKAFFANEAVVVKNDAHSLETFGHARLASTEQWTRAEAMKITADVASLYEKAKAEISTVTNDFFSNTLKRDKDLFQAKVDALINKLKADIKAAVDKI